MGLIANLGINLDTRDAAAKLKQFVQGTQSAGKAAEQLQAGATKAGQAAAGIGQQTQSVAGKLRQFAAAAGDAQSRNTALAASATTAAEGIKKQGEAADGATSAFRKFGGILASIGVTTLTANLVRNAASAEQLQLRLRLLSQEYGETDRLQAFVAESAKQFGQSQTEAAQNVTDAYARLRPIGITLEQIQTTYRGFNAVALASGASAEATSGAFLQLSQALGSGRLQGDEFRSIAEQVPGILQLVAKELGVTVGQLKQLGSDGKITSDVLINALAKGFDENKNKINELLQLSPAQKFKEFQNATTELSNSIGSELLPAIVPLVQSATELIKKFGELPGPVKTVIAATLGLTAAVIALAPAFAALPPLIAAVQAALAGISAAGLLAAGPWIALAAGIGAAVFALSQYKNESQRVAAAARTGTAADAARARNQLVGVEQEISLLKQKQVDLTGRDLAANNRKLASLRRQSEELKKAIAVNPAELASKQAPTIPTATADGATGGGAKPKAAPKGPDNTAAQIQQENIRFREQADLQNIIRDFQFQGRDILAEEQQLQAEILRINYERADALKAANFEGERRQINALAESKIIAARAESEDRIREIKNRQFQEELQNQQAVRDAAKVITDVREQQELQFKNAEEYRKLLQGGLLPAEAQRILNFKNLVEQQLKSLDVQIDIAKAALAEAQARGLAQDALAKEINLLERKRKAIQDAAVQGPGPAATDADRIQSAIDNIQGELNELTNIANIVINSATLIGDAFAGAFEQLVTGAGSAREVLSNFFKEVAQGFLKMATQIIAKQITMLILQTALKALGAAVGGSSGPTSFGADNPVGDFAFGAAGPIPADTAFPGFAKGGAFNRQGYVERYARGGVISRPTMFQFAKGGSFAPGLMGEAGPEAILPLQRTPNGRLGVTMAMPRQGAPSLRESMDRSRAGGGSATVINMSFQATRFMDREWVDREQLEAAMAKATKDGGVQGERRALAKLQNSPRTRTRLALR